MLNSSSPSSGGQVSPHPSYDIHNASQHIPLPPRSAAEEAADVRRIALMSAKPTEPVVKRAKPAAGPADDAHGAPGHICNDCWNYARGATLGDN